MWFLWLTYSQVHTYTIFNFEFSIKIFIFLYIIATKKPIDKIKRTWKAVQYIKCEHIHLTHIHTQVEHAKTDCIASLLLYIDVVIEAFYKASLKIDFLAPFPAHNKSKEFPCINKYNKFSFCIHLNWIHFFNNNNKNRMTISMVDQHEAEPMTTMMMMICHQWLANWIWYATIHHHWM